jgi:hypothetical protein
MQNVPPAPTITRGERPRRPGGQPASSPCCTAGGSRQYFFRPGMVAGAVAPPVGHGERGLIINAVWLAETECRNAELLDCEGRLRRCNCCRAFETD